MRLRTFVSVFFLTLAALAIGPLLAAQAAVLQPDPSYRNIAIVLGIALAGAAVGSLGAAFVAISKLGRAVTATQKAFRTLLEGVGMTLTGVVINTAADVVSFPRVLLPLVLGTVIATAVTYLQNLAPPPPVPTS